MEFALTVPVVFKHVKVDVVELVALGGVVLEVTVTVEVLTQLFAGLVTVTVYVFDALTVAVAVAAPETIPVPVQAYVTPEVVELALTVPVAAIHVIVDVVEELAFGCTVFVVTVTVDGDDAHPLVVTTKVYVPGFNTLG